MYYCFALVGYCQVIFSRETAAASKKDLTNDGAFVPLQKACGWKGAALALHGITSSCICFVLPWRFSTWSELSAESAQGSRKDEMSPRGPCHLSFPPVLPHTFHSVGDANKPAQRFYLDVLCSDLWRATLSNFAVALNAPQS